MPKSAVTMRRNTQHTNYPREIAEMALAHTIESAVEAAYRRGDLLKKRALMMQGWADYCDTPIGRKGVNVVPIKAA